MGTAGYFLKVALRLAKITAFLGVIWNCIQCAFQTKDVRRAAVDAMTKFSLFLLIMSIYPVATSKLLSFSLALGRESSGIAVGTLNNSLSKYLATLEQVAKNTGITQAEEDSLQDAIDVQMNLVRDINNQMNGMSRLEKNYFLTMEGGQNRLQNAEAEIEKLSRRKKSIENSGIRKKINALRSVLVTDSGSNRAGSYHLDLDMKSPIGGKSLGLLSPDAIARVSLLSAELMWENEWAFDVVASSRKDNVSEMTEEEKDVYRIAVMDGSKGISFLKFPAFAFIRAGFVGLCCLALLLTTAGCLLQYVMAICEYFITTSFCITLVPLMLFDGTADFSRKVLPTLLAQAVKLSLITLCMFFNCYMYIKMAMNQISSTSPFGWSDAFYIIFSSLLTFAITVNAPKIAATIMTGQPQLSMGEFVQTATAAIGAGVATAHAIKTGVKAGITAGAIGARQVANRGGDLLAMAGAAQGVLQSGGSAFKAAGAAGAELASRTGKRIQSALSSLAHYSPKGGFGAGGGAGGSAGAKDRLNAGEAYQNNRQNQNANEFIPGARDANNNMVSRDFADTAAMNYKDAKNNNGHQYTGNMSLMDYWKSQFFSARAKITEKTTTPGFPDAEGATSNPSGPLPPFPSHDNMPVAPKPVSPAGSAGNARKAPRQIGHQNVKFMGALQKMSDGTYAIPENVSEKHNNKEGAKISWIRY